MSESTELTQRLVGFTPEAGSLNPDAILFAAGRASMRSPLLRWKMVAAGLLILNGITLAVLWPKDADSVSPVDATMPIPDVSPPPVLPSPSPSEGTLAWQRRWLSGDHQPDPAVSIVGEIPDPPVLTVLSGRGTVAEY